MTLANTIIKAGAAMTAKALPRARGRRRERGGMTGVEKKYEAHLTTLRNMGMIAWFAFESIKLRLADNTFYTCDFAVLRNDGFIELHEVKPATKRDGRETYWCEEDAKQKVKVVAELYPFIVCIVYPTSAGWKREEF
jgi:hypothetical protein